MPIDLSPYKYKKEKEKNHFGYLKKISDKKKEILYEEFALLIKAGIDFKTALDILIAQTSRKHEKEILEKIQKDIVKGKSLFDALKTSNFFSPYEYYSVKIGEETNQLETVFLELANYFNRKTKIKRQLISVLTYPFFVIVITGIVLFFMLNNVVPMFNGVYKQFGSELPEITKKIIYLSKILPYIITGILVIIFSLIIIHIIYKKNNKYRKIYAFLLINIPIFGKIIKKIYLIRFTQSMALLLKAKVSIVESLDLVGKMINFFPLEIVIKNIIFDIKKGLTFGESIEKQNYFDIKTISMLQVGEKTNKLDEIFNNITIQNEVEIEHQTKLIGVIMEPLIIIIIGIIVGIIMIAMYSPMFNLSKILGSS